MELMSALTLQRRAFQELARQGRQALQCGVQAKGTASAEAQSSAVWWKVQGEE